MPSGGVPDDAPDLALLRRGDRRLVGPAGSLIAQLGLNAARPHLGHPLAADVVAPTFEHREVERRRQAEAVVHLGEVLLGQLVLQRLGRRGDDDLLAAQRSRDEVGQGLARSRAGLDHQVGSRDDRLGHGAAHLLLLRPVLAAGHLRRDLVQPPDAVVPRQPGVRFGPTRGAEDIEIVEAVGLGERVVEVLTRHRR